MKLFLIVPAVIIGLIAGHVMFNYIFPVTQEEAYEIAQKEICPYFLETGMDCVGVQPNERRQNGGIYSFDYQIQKNPEYSVVIMVQKQGSGAGWVEVSKWDERN